jgi:hypothetical protein
MNAYDEERLAELLRSLPPPPEGWVEAAQELPFLRAQLDDIVQRAEQDADFRRALVADLEAALTEAGYEPSDPLVKAIRARLSE